MERDISRPVAIIRAFHFNSRAHVERDKAVDDLEKIRPYISTHALTWSATEISEKWMDYLNNFNSRAHVERDQPRHLRAIVDRYFNSRAHVERDIF